MPIFHAIVLGLVQGLTEFLPVSSSGHLLLVPWLMGWNDFADVSVEKAFDVALHLGTLIAVAGYFRKDLAKYIQDGLRMVFQRQRPSTPEGRLAWLLVGGSTAWRARLFSDVATRRRLDWNGASFGTQPWNLAFGNQYLGGAIVGF